MEWKFTIVKYFGFRRGAQHLEDEKNSSEFFEQRVVRQNHELEKKRISTSSNSERCINTSTKR